MPKKRVADIARERGLEPAEVARRLAAAVVKLSGDTVDEAAAARALGGSRPARNGKRQGPPEPIGRAAQPVAPHRPAGPPTPQAQTQQPRAGGGGGQGQQNGPQAQRTGQRPGGPPRSGGAPARPPGTGTGGRGEVFLPPEGGGARPRPTAATPGGPPARAARP